MLYTSEVTGKSYKTVKELEKAEEEFKKAEEEKLQAVEVKKARAKEVEDAYANYLKVREEAFKLIAEAEKKWVDLRDKFAEDYHGYHMTYCNNNGQKTITFGDLFNTFFERF